VDAGNSIDAGAIPLGAAYGSMTGGNSTRMDVPGALVGTPSGNRLGIGGIPAPVKEIASACISVVTTLLAVGSMRDP